MEAPASGAPPSAHARPPVKQCICTYSHPRVNLPASYMQSNTHRRACSFSWMRPASADAEHAAPYSFLRIVSSMQGSVSRRKLWPAGSESMCSPRR